MRENSGVEPQNAESGGGVLRRGLAVWGLGSVVSSPSGASAGI